MDSLILIPQHAAEASDNVTSVLELSDTQLALVGGGIGDFIPG